MAVLDGARAFGRSQCGETSADGPRSERKAKTSEGKMRVGARLCYSELAMENCGTVIGGVVASAVSASAMVYGRANLAKKDKGSALVLTEAWIGPEMACKASATRSGGGRRSYSRG